jgi:hypothetical protein
MSNDIENNNKPTIREWFVSDSNDTYIEINEKEIQRFRIVKWNGGHLSVRIINDGTGESTAFHASTEKERKALKAFAIKILKYLD